METQASDSVDRSRKRSLTRIGPSKVPEVTVLFWVAKIVSTGMGETTSDFFVKRFVPEIAVVAAGVVLVVALVLQFRSRSYSPVRYWFAVAMVSVFGTMAADALHVVVGIPYLASTIALALVLAAIFVVWHQVEGTLSIHAITSRRREGFYWATVLATFALGTAVGDLTASTFGLGYLVSGLVFAACFAVPIVGILVFRLNRIAAFWIAYVLTRPLGASFADWMGVSPARHGLGLGTGPVSIALVVILIVVVGAITVLRNRDAVRDRGRHAAAAETGTGS